MDEQLCDLEITEKGVLSELERSRDDKAAGADDLVPRFFRKIKGGISMTRRASHPQYTMGILRSRMLDKGPGVQVG